MSLASHGRSQGQFGQTNYSAAKAGVHGFTLALAQPDEVADAVAFLSADETRYITGANLPVNGGLYMCWPLFLGERGRGPTLPRSPCTDEYERLPPGVPRHGRGRVGHPRPRAWQGWAPVFPRPKERTVC